MNGKQNLNNVVLSVCSVPFDMSGVFEKLTMTIRLSIWVNWKNRRLTNFTKIYETRVTAVLHISKSSETSKRKTREVLIKNCMKWHRRFSTSSFISSRPFVSYLKKRNILKRYDNYCTCCENFVTTTQMKNCASVDAIACSSSDVHRTVFALMRSDYRLRIMTKRRGSSEELRTFAWNGGSQLLTRRTRCKRERNCCWIEANLFWRSAQERKNNV